MQHNGGVFLPPWGKVEQWLLSVQHDRDDVDRFAAQLRPVRRGGSALTVDAPVKGGAIRLERAGQVVRRGAGRQPASTSTSRRASSISLLGASGCGKTTTLRMIAGFEKPDSGRILLDGRDVAGDPPHKRPVNTVFQTYALFPFMTVWDNVAFGLKYQKASQRGRPSGASARRWSWRGWATSPSGAPPSCPAASSSGSRWRGRWCCDPRVLLLDEPLGALDAKLRKQLQLELRAVQREVGITFVYVTHDQEEALTMSDQIAVLAEGRVEQVGPPQEIYSAPATTFVAGFLGAANIFDADVLEADDGSAVCSALDTRLGAAVEDEADRRRGRRPSSSGPSASRVQGADEPVGQGRNAIAGRGLAGGLPRPLHAGARRCRSARRADRRGGQPRRARVRSATSRESGCNCVCTHDAVRVLHRSSAAVDHRPGGRRPRRAQPFLDRLAAALLLRGGRSSSRSANRIAMS